MYLISSSWSATGSFCNLKDKQICFDHDLKKNLTGSLPLDFIPRVKWYIT